MPNSYVNGLAMLMSISSPFPKPFVNFVPSELPGYYSRRPVSNYKGRNTLSQ